MDHKDEIKQRIDIVDLVGEYIQLKPAGTGRMKANCPFHQEKTPSFFVSRERQIFHCFGCNENGDIFSFVMKMEGLDFSEALRQLGEKAGVKIERFVSTDTNQRARLISLLELAARFYRRCLTDSERAKIARDYLAKRGVPDELVGKFQLGYAFDEWDTLLTFLKKKGFREQEVVDAGLAVRRQDQSGAYDRFRHRLMFPITDVRGKVVGFSGRLLDETRDEGKYINTPQTLVYNKSQILYGLALGKQAIKQSGAVVVVEGNMDVIASHKAGVEAVVASSGTAFTEEQLRLLGRFTDTILMCFDADPAGETAAKRGIDLALRLGMNVKVIRLPAGVKDTDELVAKDPAAWGRAIAGATDVMTYYFEKAFASGAPKSAAEKKRVGGLLLPEIARLTNPIERSHWLHELAARLGTSEQILEETLGKLKREPRTENRELRTEKVAQTDRHSKLADALVSLFLTRDDMRAALLEHLRPEDLPHPHHELYLSAVSEYHTVNATGSPTTAHRSAFFATLRGKIATEKVEHCTILDRLVASGEEWYADRDAKEVRGELDFMIGALREVVVREERARIAGALREAEGAGNKNEVSELMKKISELM